MEVLERALKEAVHRVEVEPGTGDAAWFAVRQPGVIKYLENRCGRDDSMGVALMASFAIHCAFERELGVAPPRVPSFALERVEDRVAADPGLLVRRQHALAEFIAGVVAAPPVPLADHEATRLALVLATVVQAFDEAVAAPAP
jgi:hypothetical protein